MLPTVEVWTWVSMVWGFFQNRHYATIDDTRRGTTSLTTSQIWNTTTYTIISHSDFLDQNFIHEQFLMEVAAAVTLQINHHHNNKCEILGKSLMKMFIKTLHTQFWEIDSTLFLINLPHTYVVLDISRFLSLIQKNCKWSTYFDLYL